MGKIKVFCSGCTEHIGIIEFLKKINPNNDYECFNIKNSCRNSADDVRKYVYKDNDNKLRVRSEATEINIKCPISGKTGKALRKFAKQWVHTFYKRGTYSGYIFLDDLDSDPFSGDLAVEHITEEYWNIIYRYDKEIENEIRAGVTDIKLIIVLAIPEIESWFLYEWDTAVKDYYADEPLTCAIELYLKDNAFAGYWDKFEEWCSKKIYGMHCKMSNYLIKSFDDLQYLDPLEQNDETMPNMHYLGLEDIKFRHENEQIRSYVKKQDGPYILSILDPLILETKSNYLKGKFKLIRDMV